METNKKNNDCYFYYYSTCLKGDGCTFRHEPSALGSETVCSYWAQGKCMNVACNFRHMELKKNRKTIPCYWESQPNGCRKSHCPFQHSKTQREAGTTENGQSNDCDGVDLVKPLDIPEYHQRRSAVADGGESSEDRSRRLAQDFNTTTIDPVVVNFEEESDNESVPMSSPTKRVVVSHAQTMEEMHLERIQAELAAFYSYDDSLDVPSHRPEANADFRILTLAEIRSRSSVQDNAVVKNVSAADGRHLKPAAQIRVERAASGRLHKYADGVKMEIGVKRKQVDVVRSYKRRAHSPIKFDITHAEPVANTDVFTSEPKSLDKVNANTKLRSYDEKIHHGSACEVKAIDSSVTNPPVVKLHSTNVGGISKPIKLKRKSKVVQSSEADSIEHTSNISSSTQSLQCSTVNIEESVSSSTADIHISPAASDKSTTQKESSCVVGTLIEMVVNDIIGAHVSSSHTLVQESDMVDSVGEQVLSSIGLTQCGDKNVCDESEILELSHSDTSLQKLNDGPDSSVDEEMLLEDLTADDDFLQEDIDALLDD